MKMIQGEKMFGNIPVFAFYLVVAALWGIVLVFIVPPFQVPDEPSHYIRVAGVSHGDFSCRDGMVTVEDEERSLIDGMNTNGVAFNSEVLFESELISAYSDEGSEQLVPAETSSCTSSVVSYIPSGVALWLTESAGTNELVSFYAARIVNLSLGILIIACALYIIPYGKRLVLVIGLLPMVVFLLASLNYDALFIPIGLLFVSLICNVRASKISSAWKFAMVGLTGILLVSIKIVYLPLLILPLVLLRRNSRRTNLYLTAIFVLWAVCVALHVLSPPGGVLAYPEWVDPDEQITYLLSSPISFVVVLARSLYHDIFYYVQGVIGIFGWLDYKLHVLVYLLLAVAGAVFVLGEKYRDVLRRMWERILFISVPVATCTLVLLSMYLYSSEPKFPVIQGVQGRYFIPLALPAALAVFHFIPQVVRKVQVFGTAGVWAYAAALAIAIADMIILSIDRYWAVLFS